MCCDVDGDEKEMISDDVDSGVNQKINHVNLQLRVASQLNFRMKDETLRMCAGGSFRSALDKPNN
jgi:hypothetical protein